MVVVNAHQIKPRWNTLRHSKEWEMGQIWETVAILQKPINHRVYRSKRAPQVHLFAKNRNTILSALCARPQNRFERGLTVCSSDLLDPFSIPSLWPRHSLEDGSKEEEKETASNREWERQWKSMTEAYFDIGEGHERDGDDRGRNVTLELR